MASLGERFAQLQKEGFGGAGSLRAATARMKKRRGRRKAAPEEAPGVPSIKAQRANRGDPMTGLYSAPRAQAAIDRAATKGKKTRAGSTYSILGFLEQRAKGKEARGEKLGFLSKAALKGGALATAMGHEGGVLGHYMDKRKETAKKEQEELASIPRAIGPAIKNTMKRPKRKMGSRALGTLGGVLGKIFG